jgi:hypothetical protein
LIKLIRIFIIIIALLAAQTAAFSNFRDIPAGHWSNMAVYEIAQMGITQGYPDGTFRGDKLINRYEIAAFLAKLERVAIYNNAVSDKVVEELKVELEDVKEDIARIKGEPEEIVKLSGSAKLRARQGRTSQTEYSAAKIDYRVKTALSKDFGRDFSVTVFFDTLDAGLSGIKRNLLTEMLNVEGKAQTEILGLSGDLIAKAGPGKVTHRELGNYFAADDYTIFANFNNSVAFSTKLKGYALSLSYVARSVKGLGDPYSNAIESTIGLPKVNLPVLNDVSVSFTPRYIFSDFASPTYESKDVRCDMNVSASPADKLKLNVLFGMKSGIEPDRSYLKLGVSLNDYFNTGTYLSVTANKIGKDYRVNGLDKYEFSIYNMFDRFILDNTVDLGIEFSQELSESLKAYIKGDTVVDKNCGYGKEYPGSSFTGQYGLLVYIPSGMALEAFYKVYEVPSGIADAADPVKLMRDVPKYSDLFSLSMTYSF